MVLYFFLLFEEFFFKYKTLILYILLFLVAVAIYLVSGEDNERSKLVLGIYLGGLALFVGCADMLGGYDRYIYGEVFDQLALIEQNDGDMLVSAGYQMFASEWGFLWFNRIVGYVTLNRYVFIFILTCVIYSLLFVSIKRYCRNYPFAVIVFLGLWFFFTFTYLRQVMAATIGWLAIQYAIDRKPIPYFLIVFIAFTFHNSAIVLAPLYFVPIKKINPLLIIAIMVACIGIGMTNILGSLFAASDAFTSAAKVSENVNYIEEGAFRVAYLVEAVLFLSIILWKYNIFDENDKKQIEMLNMALLFCAMLLIFIRSDNGGRFSWHFMIGMIATITHIATHPLHRNSAFTGALVMMFAVLFLRILILWGGLLSPYKTFFTDGYREHDKIHEIYEYDARYDEDKFYK